MFILYKSVLQYFYRINLLLYIRYDWYYIVPEMDII